MPILSDDIIRSMSTERFATYLNAVDQDARRAFRLYLWNAEIGSAFYLPVQAVEIVLRNQINRVLARRFAPNWWQDETFAQLIGHQSCLMLKSRVAALRSNGKPIVPSDMVASISFGFWVTLIRKQPRMILKRLSLAEPNERDDLPTQVNLVHQLRNRIAHHEPIFRRDLLADHGIAMRLLRILCPATHDWIRPHCRVPQLVRRKP